MLAIVRIAAASAALAATPAAPAPAPAATPRAITLEEALTLAESKSPELEASRDVRDAARQETSAANAELLPQMSATASALQWDRDYAIDFGGAQFLVRKHQTQTVDIRGYQPLSGLYPIREKAIAAGKGADAADADLSSAREGVRLRTTQAYLQLLETLDLQAIADNAVKDIEEQRRIAEKLMQAGTLIRLDLTRTEVALAEAKQNQLHAKAAVGIATAALDALIGEPPTTRLAPAAPDEASLPTVPESVDAALQTAAKHRPELVAVRARAAAAVAGHRAAFGGALPMVGIVGQYERLEGITFGQPRNAAFIGASASWDFWDWGKKYHDVKAAGARAKAAEAQISARERDVSLEVTTRFLDAQAAYAAVDVAKAAVGQAEEAYRVTRSLYENGNANTTDVLDAELALARARSNDARARYDYRISYAAFARAAALDLAK